MNRGEPVLEWEDVKEAVTGSTDEEKTQVVTRIRERCRIKDVEEIALTILIKGSNGKSAESDRKRLESYGITEGTQVRLRGALEVKESKAMISRVKTEKEEYDEQNDVQIIDNIIEVKKEDENSGKWIPKKLSNMFHLTQQQEEAHQKCSLDIEELTEDEAFMNQESQCNKIPGQDLNQMVQESHKEETKLVTKKRTKVQRRGKSKTPIPVIEEAKGIGAKLIQATRTVKSWKTKSSRKGENECSMCAKVFPNPHQLRNHVREIHLAGKDPRGPSPVWDHFGKFKQDNKTWGQCKYCQEKLFILQSSTTPLLNHLKTKHEAALENQQINSRREWPLRMLVLKYEGCTYCLLCAHAKEQSGRISEAGGAMRRHFVKTHSGDSSVRMILEATRRSSLKSEPS